MNGDPAERKEVMPNQWPAAVKPGQRQRKIMKYSLARAALCCAIIVGWWSSPAAFAQDATGENKGTDAGGYNIQQTMEVGYRANWVNGNQDTYDTFINLGSGVRLLDYSVEMRSLDHHGLLFDNLSFSSFGYGGDPNDVSRLRIQKNKYYDFRVLFRRDKNFWDWNLLANPLNPITTNAAVSPTTADHHLAACARSGTPHAGLRSDAVSPIRECDGDWATRATATKARDLHHGRRNDTGVSAKLQLYDECLPRRCRFSHSAAHHDILRPVPELLPTEQ